MSYCNVETVKELREAHKCLARCCLECKDEIDPVRIVASGTDGDDEPRAWCIFENSDGRYGVIDEWEDYTGHG